MAATYRHTNGMQNQTVLLEFNNINDIPNYLKVTIFPINGIPTPLLFFSPSDQTCQNDRQVLSRRTDGLPTSIFIKKGQFSSEELFIYAQCENVNCEYFINFEGAQFAEIDVNSVYSYVVATYNREMNFEVLGNVEDGSYLTIGVEGSTSAEINFDNEDNEYQQFSLDTGKIVTFPINNPDNNILTTFNIKKATVGEYLTLSIHVVYDNLAPDNFLYPNGPVVMGLITKFEGFFKEECFPISLITSDKYNNTQKFYLTGKVYSKYGLFWVRDQDGNSNEESLINISDGLISFLVGNSGKSNYICFGFSSDSEIKMDYVAFSISILEPQNLENFYNFYPPQILGQKYRRMIPKGGFAVYSGAEIALKNKRVNFNLYNKKGIAEMYVTKCKTFPDCIYTEGDIQNFIKPKRVNRMTIWETNIDKEYEALAPEKYVMVVYCKDDNDEDDNLFDSGYCVFDTSVNIPGQTITLVENEPFYKYAVRNEKGIIKIDLKGGRKIQNLNIDIMIFSGDITFDVENFENTIQNSYHKYYLSNKIFYHFNIENLSYDNIELEYIAQINSFFNIKYSINSSILMQIEENILSDENYLVQIDPILYSKTIYISNYRVKKSNRFS